MSRVRWIACWCLTAAVAVVAVGCRSPRSQRERADRVALGIVEQKQVEAVGEAEPFTVEPPEVTLRERLLIDQDLQMSEPASMGSQHLEPIPHWPEEPEAVSTNAPSLPWDIRENSVKLRISDALVLGARSSREFQDQKEQLFTAALQLDLERFAFRNQFSGMVDALVNSDFSGEETVSGAEGSAEFGITRKFLTGAELTGRIAVDLVKLLTLDRSSAYGIFADASVSIPLLRGAGKHIAGEPLTQAERNVVYAVWEFERFKRTFAVQIANSYLTILQDLDRIRNQADNYRSLVANARRSKRLAEAGRLPPFQVDQAAQDVLQARSSWIGARLAYARRLDAFKILLGLPTDAEVELDPEAIDRLDEMLTALVDTSPQAGRDEEPPPASAPVILEEPGPEGAGPMEFDETFAVEMALENRLDLKVRSGNVFDAQRAVVIAADALRADLTLGGTAQAGERRSLGSASAGDATLAFEEGQYAGLLNLDLPIQRLPERNAYRQSLINLEQSVRSLQQFEDTVKLDIRNDRRDLLESRENVKIQAQAVELATRRVKSTDLLLQAGRAEVRDVLESQNALLQSQNALTAALVSYRIAELSIQRDMGVLRLTEEGMWDEFETEAAHDEDL